MPKSISGPVGKGGKNRGGDVLTVQYLLNCVPKSNGGPAKELILDGLCGTLTEAAIVQFQRTALGFADGRVDAGGQTIETLLCYDPYPSMKLTLPTVDSSGKGNGKRGGNPMNNCWDPFGYYNPSHENYRKSGHEPPPFEGKQDNEIKNSGAYGHKDGASGWKDGGQQGAKGAGSGWKDGGQQGAKGAGYGWKDGQQGTKGAGYGGKSGQGQQGVGGSGGKAGTGQQAGLGGKLGTGQQNSGVWPNNSNQPTVLIGDGGFPGKTGSPPQSNTKGSQSQGGIVGKV